MENEKYTHCMHRFNTVYNVHETFSRIKGERFKGLLPMIVFCFALPIAVCRLWVNFFLEFFRFIFRCNDYALYISIFIVFFLSPLALLDRLVRLRIEYKWLDPSRLWYIAMNDIQNDFFCFSVDLSQFIWSKKGSKKYNHPKWVCKIRCINSPIKM